MIVTLLVKSIEAFAKLFSGLADSFFGALFGAFFAFVFGLLLFFTKKVLERKNKGYNTTVRLEGYIAAVTRVNSENINYIESLKPVLKLLRDSSQQQNTMLLTPIPRKLKPIPFYEEHVTGLCNLNLANELSIFHSKLYDLNSNIDACNNHFSHIVKLAEESQISLNDYIAGLNAHLKDLEAIQSHSTKIIQKELVRVKGITMFLIEHKPWYAKMILFFIDDGVKLKKHESEIQKMINKAEQEVKVDSEKYKKQLEAIMSPLMGS